MKNKVKRIILPDDQDSYTDTVIRQRGMGRGRHTGQGSRNGSRRGPTQIGPPGFLTKEKKQFNGRRRMFSTDDIGAIGHPCKKNLT